MRVVPGREHLPVAGAREGNPDAWDRLFRRYQLPLYAYAAELLHDEHAAMDVVQETFHNAIRHIGGLRDDAKFGSWLFGIARQRMARHWRKSGREEQADEATLEQLPDETFTPSEWAEQEEEISLFMARLDTLPQPQREALLLHYIEDFPLEEISHITGVPLGTVKSRLHHARKTLRALLERELK